MPKSFFYIYIFVFSIVITACSGGVNTPNPNAPKSNTNVNTPNTNNPLAVATPTPKSTTNNAPTLMPVYKAYCAAAAKNDDAGIRKVYSTDSLKAFEIQMKKDGVKTLAEFLSDDQASNELCDVRNEQINGDTAVAEVRTKGYPNGIEIVFARENGEWKITNRRPDGALK